jgi:hypothetical protein
MTASGINTLEPTWLVTNGALILIVAILRQVAATVVGHKVAFKGDKVKMWAHDNHIALCWSCNSYQCVVFEGGFGRTPAPMPQRVNTGGVKQ